MSAPGHPLPFDTAVTRVLGTLTAAGASAERRAWRVPGRLEVLGKHTDYAGGRSLLAATEPALVVAAAPRGDRRVRVTDIGRDAVVELALAPDLAIDHGSWGRYPTTVARRLARDFPDLATGAEIAFASSLPSAAGVSSSSALVVAMFTALAAVNDLAARPEYRAALSDGASLATYLGSIESGAAYGPFAADFGVGTAGGSEDHTAILLGRRGALGRFAFCPVRPEASVPLPAGLAFVVAGSGVHAAKASGARDAFNRLASTAAALVAVWRRDTGGDESTLGAILELPGAAERLAGIVRASAEAGIPPPELLGRLDQFVLESEHAVPGAAAALVDGDLGRFAAWVERSVEAGVRGLGNQVPETLALVASARRLGAIAASPFGAGFGGSVWALLPTDDAAAFGETWLADHRAAFPACAARAGFFLTGAADGLSPLLGVA